MQSGHLTIEEFWRSENQKLADEVANLKAIKKMFPDVDTDAEIKKIEEKIKNNEKKLAEDDSISADPAISVVPATPAVLSKAVPLRFFSKEEVEKIRERNESNSEHLKDILEAAIGDDKITLDLVDEPVFIRREGYTLNRKTIYEQILKDADQAKCFFTKDITFTKEDIIPCNSLIRAMDLYLCIIDQKPYESPAAKEKKCTFVISEETGSEEKAVLSETDVKFITAMYQGLSKDYKALFDSICKDPLTGKIMRKPVFLPDGYAYDASTAKAYLELMNGQCPLNSAIKFTAEDITPCYYVIAVYEQLKQHASKVAKVPLKEADQEKLRGELLQEIKDLLTEVEQKKDKNDKQVNPDMSIVLKAAAQSLLFVKPELLQEAKAKNHDYDAVATFFAGKKNSTDNSKYRNFAMFMGTTRGQVGDEVGKLVRRVEEALKGFVPVAGVKLG